MSIKRYEENMSIKRYEFETFNYSEFEIFTYSLKHSLILKKNTDKTCIFYVNSKFCNLSQ